MGALRNQLEKQNKEWLVSTLLSVGDAMVTVQNDGTIEFVNSGALELLALSYKDAINKPFHDVIKVYADDQLGQVIFFDGATVLEGGLPRGAYLLNHSGEKIYLSAKTSQLRDNNQYILGYVVVFRNISRIIEAEKRIQSEKNSLETMFELMPSGLVIIDSKFQMMKVNKSFLKLFDLKENSMRDEVLGDALQCVWSFENGCGNALKCKLCHFRTMVRKTITSSKVVRDEVFQVTVKYGEEERTAWLNVSVMSMIFNDQNAYLFTIDDVTVQVTHQKTLEEARNTSLMLLDNLPVMIYRFDARRKSQFINDTFKRFLGAQNRGLENRGIENMLSDRMKPEHYAQFTALINQCFESHKSFRVETELMSIRGTYRSVMGVGQPVFDDNNDFTGILGIFLDVHEAKIAQQLYLKSQIKYKLLFEHLESSISYHKMVVDASGNIVDSVLFEMNSATLKLFGAEGNQFKDKKLSELKVMDNEVKQLFFNRCEQVLRTGTSVHISDYYFQLINRWVEIDLYSPEENVIVVLIIDVDYKTRAELALKQAKERSEEANRAKSDFLANMSHEIRTPLNGIVGMIDLTLLEKVTDEQKDNLFTAKSCVHSLIDIINDVLDFSKIEAGKLSVNPENFDLYDLFESTMKTHSVHADEKQIELSVIYENLPYPYLVGDAKRIKQVLNNLLSNAIKFTHSGRVKMYVHEKHNVEKGGIFLNVAIEDTGIGIPDEKKVSLFKSFTQVDGSYTRQYGGTGLGLVISKQLVELMGGEIGYKSEMNKGSTFSFTVPLSISDKPIKKDEIQEEVTPNFSGRRVLLVEDDKVNQMVMAKMLEQMGFAVDYAVNGLEAVTASASSVFDLVLMDIQMPIMDGMKATETIRKGNGFNEKTPIIALTAYALKGDEALFMASGMDAYLSKPVNRSHLIEMLHRFLDRTPGLLNDHHERIIIDRVKAFANQQTVLMNTEVIESVMHKLNYIDELIRDENSVILEITAHQVKQQFEQLNAEELKNLAFKMELEIRKDRFENAKLIVGRIREMLNMLEV